MIFDYLNTMISLSNDFVQLMKNEYDSNEDELKFLLFKEKEESQSYIQEIKMEKNQFDIKEQTHDKLRRKLIYDPFSTHVYEIEFDKYIIDYEETITNFKHSDFSSFYRSTIDASEYFRVFAYCYYHNRICDMSGPITPFEFNNDQYFRIIYLNNYSHYAKKMHCINIERYLEKGITRFCFKCENEITKETGIIDRFDTKFCVECFKDWDQSSANFKDLIDSLKRIRIEEMRNK